MKTEDYVPYELAVKLKNKGFNWPCDMYYATQNYCEGNNPYSFDTISKGDLITSPKMKEDVNDGWIVDEEYAISAPFLWEAQKWLREDTHYVVYVTPYYYEMPDMHSTLRWAYYINRGGEDILDEGKFDTYEEALSAGIAKALELI